MSHTRHLSLYEDLAYRRLLDFYFLHEQPIKHRDAARQIGMRDHEEDVLTVLNEFFLSTDDGFVNPRANKEIMEFKVHQATSAYGAFVRDNPDLKQYVLKDVYIQHFMSGTVDTYIDSLKSHHVAMMGTSLTHDATNNHKPITNNHIKETQRGSRLAQDWVLTKSLGEWAQTERPDLDVRLVAEQFKDYWIAQPGQKGVKLDWSATWRNWVRNSKASKSNIVDIARVTVPMSDAPDPALEKIKADAKITRPPSLADLEKMASLRRKV